VRRHFRELELEHALRATSAQQLRVIVARRRTEVADRRIAVVEQAIADRLERILAERRTAVDDIPGERAVRTADELAVRRARRTTPARRRHTA
jgi:hypothetical protein